MGDNGRSSFILSFLSETLSMYPAKKRPYYIPFNSLFEKHSHLWIRRAVLYFQSCILDFSFYSYYHMGFVYLRPRAAAS